ncbi:exportin-2 [Phlebotomus papatasi]|uniref:Exportin-2 n=1 Tax=Phlebotomus papatasi TaxID=29031 RepID=A0A1B0CYT2_PHLPP|nr:exportin-2 [Phlebotomus papatasi]
MDLNEENFRLLAQYLQQTLNPDPNIRRPAEQFLEGVEGNQNYPILLLHLIDKEDLDMTIRVAGSVTFKNYVKRNWYYDPEEGKPDKIHETDRTAIKTLIVTLMLKSPTATQKQLSDAVSIIGKYDFPDKWPQLIDEMVEKFATGDFNVINGILQTGHSLFKRYRYEFKSQSLWVEIKLVLDKLAKPLTDLLVATMNLATTHAGNQQALKVIYGSLVLVCKVFYSLNYQDLPEFFEDNMNTWMPSFHKMLTTDVPLLRTPDDEDAGVLEQLKSQICENLCLYAQKYDEEFSPFMPQFVTAVWELLVNTGIQTKYDTLVSHALTFLGTVADRTHYRHLFEDPNVLASICEKVIIPNMDFRKSDEELFEDNPEEYIRRDIEGSDIDTRRRAACDLVKILSQKFEAKIFEIFSQYLQVLLTRHSENPQANWKAKDTAIFLVTSLASRGSTQRHGVTQTSELVPLPQFCQQHIIPELERSNVNEMPVLKADALKFLISFRSCLETSSVVACLPLIIRHLQAQSVVVHSYAACAIEKILMIRIPGQKSPVTATELSPLAGDLFSGLFGALEMAGSMENEYVMKAIMRSTSVLQEAGLPFMGSIVLPRLTQILTVVSKNPSKPHFNHYLFETLSLSIKIVCKAQASAVESFEEALFPIFQAILQQDILEFIPYVFQLLSLLLEMREGVSQIPEPYMALFPFLLSPLLWDRPGNVTPLIRLICAYIRQGSGQIVAYSKLNAVLGVFQKMIASKSNDHEGFYLLQTLLLHYPMQELQQSLRQIFVLLFQRLSLSKTTKYIRGLIIFFSFYAGKIGSANLVQMIDEIQAQMFGMVLDRVFIPELNRVSTDIDKKIVAIGIAKILCECPSMVNEPYVQFWPRLLESLLQIFEAQTEGSGGGDDDFIEVEDTPGYQVAYSQLNYAQPKVNDPYPEVTDGRIFLVQNLAKASVAQPGMIPQLLNKLPVLPKEILNKYCAQAGVQIH